MSTVEQVEGFRVAGGAATPGAPALSAGLADFAAGRLDSPSPSPLPPRFFRVVNDLFESGAGVVTLEGLARYDTGESPQALARALRSRGWLFPLRTRGAWSVPFTDTWPHTGRFRELEARLLVRPDTPACLAGKYAAHERGYLARGTEPCIGYPPGMKVPSCLDGFPVLRWQPQVLPEEIDGLPVWADETLLAFMAAKPWDIAWDDIADWLPEMCDHITAPALIAELAGRPRAVWMKSAYLADSGERIDVATAVVAAAPPGSGPYRYGPTLRLPGVYDRPPRWAPEYDVLDYVLAARWNQKWK